MIENPFNPFGLLRKLRRHRRDELPTEISAQMVEARLNQILIEKGLINTAPQVSVDAHDAYYLVNIELPEDFPAGTVFINSHPVNKHLSVSKGLTDFPNGLNPGSIEVPKANEMLRIKFIIKEPATPHVLMISPAAGTGITFRITGSTCEVSAKGSSLHGLLIERKDREMSEFDQANHYFHKFNGDGAFALAVLENPAA
jgi:hypothetical protein